jgi:hypothetical protein
VQKEKRLYLSNIKDQGKIQVYRRFHIDNNNWHKQDINVGC